MTAIQQSKSANYFLTILYLAILLYSLMLDLNMVPILFIMLLVKPRSLSLFFLSFLMMHFPTLQTYLRRNHLKQILLIHTIG